MNMKNFILVGLLFLFSICISAQETKVIKDGKKVTKEQVEKNKKEYQKKIKAAKKKASANKIIPIRKKKILKQIPKNKKI